MIWLVLCLAALAGFVFAVFILKLPRIGWTLFGAFLLFSLTGYAVQGVPDLASAPGASSASAPMDVTPLINQRRELFGAVVPPSRSVSISDGFARSGKFQDAAGFLRNALAENNNDTEAWIALGIALIAQAEGQQTPAATYALERAAASDPDHPAPRYFLGLARLQDGKIVDARDLWAQALSQAPDDASYRTRLGAQIERLDAAIEQMEAAQMQERRTGNAPQSRP